VYYVRGIYLGWFIQLFKDVGAVCVEASNVILVEAGMNEPGNDCIAEDLAECIVEFACSKVRLWQWIVLPSGD